MSRERDIIVFLEPDDGDGADVNLRLLNEACRIAAHLGGSVSALRVGTGADNGALQECGVSGLYEVAGQGLSEYSCEKYAWAVKTALADVPFRLLLFAHLDRGSDLAPRVAAYLDTAAVMDCVDIRIENGAPQYVRSVFGGQLEQQVTFAVPAREVATIRPEVLAAGSRLPDGSRSVRSAFEIIRISVEIPSDIPVTKTLETIAPDSTTVDIIYADKIVAAGTGCSEAGLLGLVEELSGLLNGSVGTTRPVVDDGHVPKKRMIGQTGKTVAPELYLALGISGSPHHVAGIQQSRKILAVNIDPRAPIFNFSDAGFVSDLKTLLPKLIERIRRYKDEGLA